jgi:ribosomal protein S18 acetylase RimI-like enzyme
MPEGVTLTEPSEAKEMVEVRGYRSSDEAQLLSLWNAALPYDLIDRRTFHRKVLLDPNFDPDWLLVADADGKLVGFCLCLIRRVPMEKVGMEVNKGKLSDIFAGGKPCPFTPFVQVDESTGKANRRERCLKNLHELDEQFEAGAS